MNEVNLRLEDSELEALISEGESWRVEFKEELSRTSRQRVAEVVCAFANDLPGARQVGVVFVGIKDDKQPAGLEVNDELLLSLADIKNEGHILPPPHLLVEKRTLFGSDVAVIVVAASNSLPVRYRGNVFVRSGPQTTVANRSEEDALIHRRSNTIPPFDLALVRTAQLSDLSMAEFLSEYLPKSVSEDLIEANKRSVEEQLTATKMIASVSDPCPTVLGVLVLGQRPDDLLPGSYVQFLRNAGTEVSGVVADAKRLTGRVRQVVTEVDVLVDLHNVMEVDFISEPLEQRRFTYPPDALKQLIRNAILHRSFDVGHSHVTVNWYDDRVVIINPGGLFGKVTEENFGTGVTDYRNPNLAEAMRNLGLVQHFGHGVPLARRLLQEAGHPEPKFDFAAGSTSVTVYAAGNGGTKS